MTQVDNYKLLFIVNPFAGSVTNDWSKIILNYFQPLQYNIEIHELSKYCSTQTIKEKIALFLPNVVVAVGGDGTVKMVAECLVQTNILLGILPAGSANGLAKELGITQDPKTALDILMKGCFKKIHVTLINNHTCIHLSDVGLNAYAIKKFEMQQWRGIWGYLVAFLKVLLKIPSMKVQLLVNNKSIIVNAVMIVIANATTYGSGAIINPIGKLDDEMFEVVVLKEISLREIFKMVISHAVYDNNKTEIFQTNNLLIQSKRKLHFQVDGEYLGKANIVNATIISNALRIIIPAV